MMIASHPCIFCTTALETAQAFWALLLPHGIQGGALSHITSRDDDGDDSMTGADEGWKLEYNSWWYEFLENEAKMKGVSKDTWMMVRFLHYHMLHVIRVYS